MQDVKRIESYGLYDFCQDVQEAFKEGYVFDFDTNENFPTAYGTMLTCGLVKSSGKKVKETTETAETTETVAQTEQIAEIVQEEQQVVTEVQEAAEAAPAKRGPKPKNK